MTSFSKCDSLERLEKFVNSSGDPETNSLLFDTIALAHETTPQQLDKFIRTSSFTLAPDFLNNLRQILEVLDVFTLYTKEIKDFKGRSDQINDEYNKCIEEGLQAQADDCITRMKALYAPYNKDAVSASMGNFSHYQCIEGIWGYFSLGTQPTGIMIDSIPLTITRDKLDQNDSPFCGRFRFTLALPLIPKDEPTRIATLNGAKISFFTSEDIEDQFYRMVDAYNTQIENQGLQESVTPLTAEGLVDTQRMYCMVAKALPIIAIYISLVDINQMISSAEACLNDAVFQKYHQVATVGRKTVKVFKGVDPKTCRSYSPNDPNYDAEDLNYEDTVTLDWDMRSATEPFEELIELLKQHRNALKHLLETTWDSYYPQYNL